MLDHGLTDMKETTLDFHLWPQRGNHRFQGTIPVDHSDLWWCHALEHAGPGGDFLPVAELPVDDVRAVKRG